MSEPSQPSTSGGGPQVNIRSKFGPFRMLIIGRANAGKTTILRKICDSTEDPKIFGHDGKEILLSALDPTADRGIHDINLELVFTSNPNFVFHDSAGMESGSSEELKILEVFIAERAQSLDPNQRLHLIGLCLPVDTARAFSTEEMKLLALDTSGVPKIVLVTKGDGLVTKNYDELRSRSPPVPVREARKLAVSMAEDQFKNEILPRLMSSERPPAQCVFVRNMHKEESNCDEIVEKMAASITDQDLQMLFVSTQRNNIALCTKYAIKDMVNYLGDSSTEVADWNSFRWYPVVVSTLS